MVVDVVDIVVAEASHHVADTVEDTGEELAEEVMLHTKCQIWR